MTSSIKDPGGPRPGGEHFATTHWSVVLRASMDGEAQAAALEELCRNYWQPLFGYVRRKGHTQEEAQDLTQGFFERLLEKSWLSDVDPTRARFRSFLLTMITRYLANEFHRGQTQKRGGSRPHLALHVDGLEDQIPSGETGFSPEQEFDRRWAITLLDRAMVRLRRESMEGGKTALFEHLSPFLSAEAEPGDYLRLSQSLQMSAGGIGVAVHRLRHRYRELVRSEVMDTLSDPQDADQEMEHLFAALRG